TAAPDSCLAQKISVDNVGSRRFAARVTTRCDGDGECRVVIRAAASAAVLAERVIAVGGDWQRHRLAFDIPGTGCTAGQLEIHVRSAAIYATDVRLVALYSDIAGIATRFNTFGDLEKASSRLRAWLIEDYLNLVGWPASMNSGRDHILEVWQKAGPRFQG